MSQKIITNLKVIESKAEDEHKGSDIIVYVIFESPVSLSTVTNCFAFYSTKVLPVQSFTSRVDLTHGKHACNLMSREFWCCRNRTGAVSIKAWMTGSLC